MKVVELTWAGSGKPCYVGADGEVAEASVEDRAVWVMALTVITSRPSGTRTFVTEPLEVVREKMRAALEQGG